MDRLKAVFRANVGPFRNTVFEVFGELLTPEYVEALTYNSGQDPYLYI